MKKLLFLLILLCGCSSKYEHFIWEINNSEITNNFPFNIEVHIDDSNINLIYQVIIDEPKDELKDIQAMVIHDKKTENIFPSIGVVDDKFDFGEKKGINLIGYVKKENNIVFKIYVKTTNNNYLYIYHYNSTSN